jgi:hypothetical protein
MSKEKVFIVLSHKNSLKKGSVTEWEVTETVEFVNQLRRRHNTTASAIGDYLNETMISGTRFGMTEYSKFEEYVRGKYKEQFAQLDAAYKPYVEPEVTEEDTTEVVSDQFGNIRARTVFDV